MQKPARTRNGLKRAGTTAVEPPSSSSSSSSSSVPPRPIPLPLLRSTSRPSPRASCPATSANSINAPADLLVPKRRRIIRATRPPRAVEFLDCESAHEAVETISAESGGDRVAAVAPPLTTAKTTSVSRNNHDDDGVVASRKNTPATDRRGGAAVGHSSTGAEQRYTATTAAAVVVVDRPDRDNGRVDGARTTTVGAATLPAANATIPPTHGRDDDDGGSGEPRIDPDHTMDRALSNIMQKMRESRETTTTTATAATAAAASSRTAFLSRHLDPRLFAESPIVPCHGAGSRQLRRMVHNWIWSPDNRRAVHRHRIAAFADAVLEQKTGTAVGAATADDGDAVETRMLAVRAAKQLKILKDMLANRASKIRLDRASHEYILVDHAAAAAADDGSSSAAPPPKIRRSVTGALEELCGTFDADLAITRMLHNKSRWRTNKLYRSCNFDAYGNELTREQISQRIREKWNESRDLGTQLHDYIDELYSKTDDPATATTSIAGDEGPCRVDVSAFRSWEAIRMCNDWLLVASEYTVYDVACGLAGTIDAIYLPNAAYPRQVVLVDWKRAQITTTVGNMFHEHPLLMRYAKGNYWKYAMQLNLYRELLEKNYHLQVIEMYLVTFPPDSVNCELYGVPKMLEAKTFLASLRARFAPPGKRLPQQLAAADERAA